MKKILFIVGSLRKNSFNRQLAQTAERLIDGRAMVEYLDFQDVPMIDQDTEFPVPVSVAAVREKVTAADGLWIFSPEYNHSYPGCLKNLIDWLSRPVVPGDQKTPLAVRGKKVALSGAGGGGATVKCREKLTELLTLPFIGADVMVRPQTGISLSGEAWTTDRLMLSPAQEDALKRQTEAFLDFIFSDSQNLCVGGKS